MNFHFNMEEYENERVFLVLISSLFSSGVLSDGMPCGKNLKVGVGQNTLLGLGLR